MVGFDDILMEHLYTRSNTYLINGINTFFFFIFIFFFPFQVLMGSLPCYFIYILLKISPVILFEHDLFFSSFLRQLLSAFIFCY